MQLLLPGEELAHWHSDALAPRRPRGAHHLLLEPHLGLGGCSALLLPLASLQKQHQVAVLKLTAVQGPACEVLLLRCLLPVLECCLRWGLQNFIQVCGQLFMEDTFLGKEGYVQLIREISRVLCQKAGWSEVSTLCPAQGAVPNRAAIHQCYGCPEAHLGHRLSLPTMEVYITMKKNVQHTTKRINIKNIMLNEKDWTVKNIRCIIPLIKNSRTGEKKLPCAVIHIR